MPNMNLNTEYTMRLSLSSIEEYEKILEEYKKKLSKRIENIVKKVSKVGLKAVTEGDRGYSAKMLDLVNDGNEISCGIKTTDSKDTYREFGTGIVGSENPHPDVMSGWVYDVNEHGEKGWIYPKGDGTFGWTKGLPAEKRFYDAMIKMENSLSDIAREEFNK